MQRRTLLQAAPMALASAIAPQLALGQTVYPNKTIRYIVPVAPGGGADI